MKVEDNASTRERLNGEQPWECDGCDGRVSFADVETCVDAESYWVGVGKVSKMVEKQKRARLANRI